MAQRKRPGQQLSQSIRLKPWTLTPRGTSTSVAAHALVDAPIILYGLAEAVTFFHTRAPGRTHGGGDCRILEKMQ
jgi:hypothetical protein